MSLRWHFPGWRRQLGWAVFCLFLAGIGAILYVALPPAPRWSLTGPMRDFLTEDGPALATYVMQGGPSGTKPGGPVQFWDTATGQEQERFLADEPAFLAHEQSRDGRYFVAVLPGPAPAVKRVVQIDLQERSEQQVEAPLGEFDSALFSRNGNYLAVRRRDPAPARDTYAIAETVTGRIVARFAVRREAPMGKDSPERGWPDTLDDGKFTDDGRFFVVNHSDEKGAAAKVVETRTGKLTIVADAHLRAVAPGSRSLIALRDGMPWIWDLTTMDWHAPLEAEAPDTLCFSPDAHWAVSVPPNQLQPTVVRVFDLHTGRLHWEFRSVTSGSEGTQEERFSPDGHYFLLPTEVAPGQRRIAMFDVAGKRELWQRTWQASFGSCAFTADSGTLISASPARVEIADAATGEIRFTIDMPPSVQLDPWVSRDGRTLYVERQPGLPEPTLWTELLEEYWPWRRNDLQAELFPLHAYDMATGRLLWRQETRFAAQLWFGADSVVMLHPHQDAPGPATVCTIDCWDTPPRKRLGWIVGSPAGIGAILVLGRAGWRRFRRRRATAPP